MSLAFEGQKPAVARGSKGEAVGLISCFWPPLSALQAVATVRVLSEHPDRTPLPYPIDIPFTPFHAIRSTAVGGTHRPYVQRRQAPERHSCTDRLFGPRSSRYAPRRWTRRGERRRPTAWRARYYPTRCAPGSGLYRQRRGHHRCSRRRLASGSVGRAPLRRSNRSVELGGSGAAASSLSPVSPTVYLHLLMFEYVAEVVRWSSCPMTQSCRLSWNSRLRFVTNDAPMFQDTGSPLGEVGASNLSSRARESSAPSRPGCPARTVQRSARLHCPLIT